jgi:hypothetical protein
MALAVAVLVTPVALTSAAPVTAFAVAVTVAAVFCEDAVALPTTALAVTLTVAPGAVASPDAPSGTSSSIHETSAR